MWQKYDLYRQDPEVAIWAMAEMERLALRLRRIRQDLSLSLQEASHMVGVSRPTLHVWEAPGRQKRLYDLQRVALAYGLRIRLSLVPLEIPPTEAAFDADGNWLGVPAPDYVDDACEGEEITDPDLLPQAIAQARREGTTITGLMQRFSIDEQQVREYLKASGVPAPRRNGGRAPTPIPSRFVDHCREGVADQQLAEMYGLSLKVVRGMRSRIADYVREF